MAEAMRAVPPGREPGLEAVVLGLGNVLRSDEGLGIFALGRLESTYTLPPGVRVVDGGTLGLELLAEIEASERLLVLDAVLSGEAPGTLARLEGDEVPAFIGRHGSAHDTGLNDVLALARWRGNAPTHLVVLGLQPERLELGWGLSTGIDAGLSALADAAATQLEQWGLQCTPRR